MLSVLGILLLGLPALVVCGEARADESQYVEFYTPPDPLPHGQPGDLIRTEPSRLVLEPSGQLGAYVATGTRIMYLSTDTHDQPIAVTGTYFEPDNPWPGQGPRPLISLAVGTYGQGDQCAPSRLFNQGIHYSTGFDIMYGYEQGFVATMVARGFAVVVTDYEGLGTPGVHTYLNRASQGHAVIDAARAAMLLPGTSLNPDGPVAFWGYSQGGGASAAAAELAPTYAPELDLVGAWAGAPPADPAGVLPFADGSILVGAIGYVLNSLMAAYPETEIPIRDILTPRGEEMVNKSKDQCTFQTLADFGFRHLQPYFNLPLSELEELEPMKSRFAEQRIGRYRPAAPVFIDQNRFDGVVPWVPAHQMALDWCAQGADVEFFTNEQPPFLNKLAVNHGLAELVDGERGMQWIADRFNGLPTTPNCGEI
jgi:triacylglycerol lipase